MRQLETYLDLFSHLKVHRIGDYYSPLKAILIVSITEMVRDGFIGSPSIHVDEKLKNRFTLSFPLRLNEICFSG